MKHVVEALTLADVVLRGTNAISTGHPVYRKIRAALRTLEANPMPETPLKALLRKIGFESFSEDDWSAYAGCESNDPLIFSTGESVIIYDLNRDGKETMAILENETSHRFLFEKVHRQ